MFLVTGATGRLGGHVVRALRQLGQPVRALVRRGSEYYWLNDTGCAYFFGDLRDETSLQRACAGATHVVACSGVEHETRTNDHQAVTVDGHARLFRIAAQAGVSRVVYVSALGVDRGLPIPWFDAKRQAEEALVGSGASWSILRPAPYTRWFVEKARQAAQGHTVILPGPGTNPVSPISVRDVALYVVAALDAPEMAEQIVELGGPEVHTPRQIVERAIELGGDGGEVRFVPTPAALLAARMIRPVGRRFSHKWRHWNAWLSQPFAVDSSGWSEALQIPLRGLDEAIKLDLEELVPLEAPDARETLVVHRRFDATVYEPGEAELDALPRGPLRYD